MTYSTCISAWKPPACIGGIYIHSSTNHCLILASRHLCHQSCACQRVQESLHDIAKNGCSRRLGDCRSVAIRASYRSPHKMLYQRWRGSTMRHTMVDSLTRDKNRALQLLFLMLSIAKLQVTSFGKASIALLNEFTTEELVLAAKNFDVILANTNNRFVEPKRLPGRSNKRKQIYRLNSKCRIP